MLHNIVKRRRRDYYLVTVGIDIVAYFEDPTMARGHRILYVRQAVRV